MCHSRNSDPTNTRRETCNTIAEKERTRSLDAHLFVEGSDHDPDGIDVGQALQCCLANTLTSPLSPDRELHLHQAVLERLRQLSPSDVYDEHYARLIRRTWYHAGRVLEITRDMGLFGDAEMLTSGSAPRVTNVILLAVEVWIICGCVADVTDRASRWNSLVYGGMTAIDRFVTDETCLRVRSRRLAGRLSAIWSAVMLSFRPSPAKRAFFIARASPTAATASSEPSAWAFLSQESNRVKCLRILFPDKRFHSENEIVLIEEPEAVA